MTGVSRSRVLSFFSWILAISHLLREFITYDIDPSGLYNSTILVCKRQTCRKAGAQSFRSDRFRAAGLPNVEPPGRSIRHLLYIALAFGLFLLMV